jgi:hypothetical protein
VIADVAQATSSGVDPGLIAILATVQVVITVVQTLAMEYLRRRYPTGSQMPPPISKRELARLRAHPETSIEPPPMVRIRDKRYDR